MRLGLIIYGSLDTLSGGYLYDRKLVEYLRSQGDCVEVVSLPWQSYPIHLLHNFSGRLRARLLNLQVDILLQDELNHPSLCLLNGWLRSKVGYPIVSIVHHLRESEGRTILHRSLYRWIEQRYLRSVDGFIFNSQTTQRVVREVCACRQPGLVATPGGDLVVNPYQKYAHSQDDEKVRILFVGNLIPRKNLHTLLAALSKLPTTNWHLQVVGRSDVDPGYAERMRSLALELGIGQRVTFNGRLVGEALTEAFVKSQVLAVPSYYEGFGIVYLEAMGHGVVPLAGKHGGAGEIIQPGVSGFLVGPRASGEIAARLSELLQNRSRLDEMSRAAVERYRSFPSWQESMHTIRQFLLNFNSGRETKSTHAEI